MRETFVLRFEGARAAGEAEDFVATLPEREFPLPGRFVADATVTEVDHALLPEERLTVTCELLVVEEG